MDLFPTLIKEGEISTAVSSVGTSFPFCVERPKGDDIVEERAPVSALHSAAINSSPSVVEKDSVVHHHMPFIPSTFSWLRRSAAQLNPNSGVTNFSSSTCSSSLTLSQYDTLLLLTHRFVLHMYTKELEDQAVSLEEKIAKENPLTEREEETYMKERSARMHMSSSQQFSSPHPAKVPAPPLQSGKCVLVFSLRPLPLLSMSHPAGEEASRSDNPDGFSAISPSTIDVGSTMGKTSSRSPSLFPPTDYFCSKASLPSISSFQHLEAEEAQEAQWSHWKSLLLPSSSSFITSSSSLVQAEIPIEFRWGVKRSQLKELKALHKVSFPLDYDLDYYEWFFFASTLTLVAYTTPGGFQQLNALRKKEHEWNGADSHEEVNPFGCVPYHTNADHVQELLGVPSSSFRLCPVLHQTSQDSTNYCSVMVGLVSGHPSYPSLHSARGVGESLQDDQPAQDSGGTFWKFCSSFFSEKKESLKFPEELLFVNPVMYIGSIAVHPVLRQSGVGGALLDVFIHYVVHDAPIHLHAFLHSHVQIYLEKSSQELHHKDPVGPAWEERKEGSKDDEKKEELYPQEALLPSQDTSASVTLEAFPHLTRVPSAHYLDNGNMAPFISSVSEKVEDNEEHISDDEDGCCNSNSRIERVPASFSIRTSRWVAKYEDTPYAFTQNTTSMPTSESSSSGSSASRVSSSDEDSMSQSSDVCSRRMERDGFQEDANKKGKVNGEEHVISAAYGGGASNRTQRLFMRSSSLFLSPSHRKLQDSVRDPLSSMFSSGIEQTSLWTSTFPLSSRKNVSSPFALAPSSRFIAEATSPCLEEQEHRRSLPNPVVQYGYNYTSSSASSSSLPFQGKEVQTRQASMLPPGAGCIWLHCLASNTPLLKFYMNRGFVIVQYLEDYYFFDGVHHTAAQLCYTGSARSASSAPPSRMETLSYEYHENRASSQTSLFDAPTPASVTAVTRPAHHSCPPTEEEIRRENTVKRKIAPLSGSHPPPTLFCLKMNQALRFTAAQVATAVRETSYWYTLQRREKDNESHGDRYRKEGECVASLFSLPLSHRLPTWWFTPDCIHEVSVEPMHGVSTAEEIFRKWVRRTIFCERYHKEDLSLPYSFEEQIATSRNVDSKRHADPHLLSNTQTEIVKDVSTFNCISFLFPFSWMFSFWRWILPSTSCGILHNLVSLLKPNKGENEAETGKEGA